MAMGKTRNMSDREARARRRANERAVRRELDAAVGPSHEDQAHIRRCVWPECTATAPAIELGVVHLALCPPHKVAFDRLWSAAIQRRSA